MPLPVPHPGSRAVITGASGTLGAALANELAARGYHLILTARRDDVLDRLATLLSGRYGVTVEVLAADLADPDQRRRLADDLARREISILVANAGRAAQGPLADVDPTAVKAATQVNVLGVHDLVLAVLPGMLTRGAGGILISGSAAGNAPIPDFATYAACKAFVNTFSESLRGELRGSGIHVTLLAPAMVRSGIDDSSDPPGLSAKLTPDFLWSSYQHTAKMALVGLERNTIRVVPGLTSKVISLVSGYGPRAWIGTRAALPIYRPGKRWAAAAALVLLAGLALVTFVVTTPEPPRRQPGRRQRTRPGG